MAKFTGTVKRSDLEGGLWLLETADGDQYQLVDATDGLEDGQQVVVEGKVDKGAFGIGMSGPTLKVSKITPC